MKKVTCNMKSSIGTLLALAILLLGLCSQNVMAAAAPTFNSAPTILGIPAVGSEVTVCVAASDPQGLPYIVTYNYGDNTTDTLGKHTYLTTGVYTGTVTLANSAGTSSASFTVTCVEIANLWLKNQSIKTGAPGTESWQAQYIYNADRTLANIFNPTRDAFAASLGTIPAIQIPSGATAGVNFTGTSPKFGFKSNKGVKPAVSVALDMSNQTVTIHATAETFADTVPGVFHNALQLGSASNFVDQAFDAKGKFTANAGYRSIAFVVASASVKFGKPGKGSANFAMFMGDPKFVFPSASANKTVRVRVTNVVNQIVVDKDLTSLAVFKAGKFTSLKDTAKPAGKFTYDKKTGKMSFALSNATFNSALSTSEEHVKVDVILGDQTYTTHVTLFAAKAGTYSTKIPKSFVNFIPGKVGDTIAPTVLATVPANSTSGVAINGSLPRRSVKL